VNDRYLDRPELDRPLWPSIKRDMERAEEYRHAARERLRGERERRAARENRE